MNVRWATLADPPRFSRVWNNLTRWISPDRLVWEVGETGTADPPWGWLRRRYPDAVWAMDDVGVGTADLWRWLLLGPSWIKIDARLIGPVPTHPRARALVQGLTAAAHACGIRVIAEGVATRAHAVAVKALGIDGGQGWAIARPAEEPVAPPLGRI